ncbi:TIGR01212 family radical SAM protein [Anaerococcus hydrogenalis]|uniref:TIGR01212 family radical SAM protein n=1 Tax=Anaerococcus hydrogenalis TaxID=33029 RepID=A0A2N6UIC6_9FIRM|nr:TIGR01212 family radical SAM protein [Anaerococcus hydrogenalis]MBS5988234.1 TIGR01212 family radical SAM protein [Anaerococcus hydrogenalis]MDK7694763.1 TIGR01212 family radical SAM protein [Anaerococcus hydrogenalis]MDK7696683.1 TIGR01212 family radical SAM protein [Anaerococcus hydrogenalis]MDK7707790.1 TIGR01212 family radical SAM protein [Anaerococcus hydrogenalis]PMC81400.1 TIGR01212 family radical SAM protein [Anaerococcus hydrogenalis]
MEINKKRYRDLDSYFKRKFNKKIIKIPLDGGFTCPNRDGKISKLGCIYCSENGAGDFTKYDDLDKQIDFQINRLKKENRKEGYMAYFQNFTSTYGNIQKMKKLFYGAINNPNIMGLSIATRADCLSDEVIDLLDDLNKKTFLVVELGLQSVNEKSIEFINRGYTHKEFDQGLLKLKEKNIKTLAHIIIGLPNEDIDDFLNDISYINQRKFWGIKVHNLYIEKNSGIYDYYLKNQNDFTMTLDQYVDYVILILENLDPNIIIQRLTGDGRRDKIIWPIWSKNKARVLSTIDKKLKDEDKKQGDLWKEK